MIAKAPGFIAPPSQTPQDANHWDVALVKLVHVVLCHQEHMPLTWVPDKDNCFRKRAHALDLGSRQWQLLSQSSICSWPGVPGNDDGYRKIAYALDLEFQTMTTVIAKEHMLLIFGSRQWWLLSHKGTCSWPGIPENDDCYHIRAHALELGFQRMSNAIAIVIVTTTVLTATATAKAKTTLVVTKVIPPGEKANSEFEKKQFLRNFLLFFFQTIFLKKILKIFIFFYKKVFIKNVFNSFFYIKKRIFCDTAGGKIKFRNPSCLVFPLTLFPIFLKLSNFFQKNLAGGKALQTPKLSRTFFCLLFRNFSNFFHEFFGKFWLGAKPSRLPDCHEKIFHFFSKISSNLFHTGSSQN